MLAFILGFLHRYCSCGSGGKTASVIAEAGGDGDDD